MDAPPVLTPERIDAMLSIMAEVCLETVVEAGQRQKAAEDDEAFDRCGRTLQRACRNLRQTIAMKQRHDREQDRKAEDGRKLAEASRKQAERARDEAVAHKQARVQRHFERLLWDEYEDDDAQERFEDLDERLDDLADEHDFLDTPTEALIQRLADEIGLGEEPADDPPEPPPAPKPAAPSHVAPGQDRKTPQASSSNRGGRREGAEGAEISASSAQSSAISAVESDGSAAGAPPICETPPPDPLPGPPPDPLPEPYIPPWEKLRPGQRMPGGTGW